MEPGEEPQMRSVRFRTLGYRLTGAIESNATTADAIGAEMFGSRLSERGRLIDSDEKASVERKKREGYV